MTTLERLTLPSAPTAPHALRRYTVPAPIGSGFNRWDALYLDGADLAALPSPPALIEGVLPAATNALLAGRDSTFKSFVALSWALSIAHGLDWHGHTVQQAPVLYVAAEGAAGLAARRMAWLAAHKLDAPTGTLHVRTAGLDLFAGGDALDDLLERVERYGVKLVVVDTLRRVSGAAAENSSDMGRVVDNVERIKRATDGGTVLTVAHTGKADVDVRGFSGIEDDADLIWRTRRRDPARLAVELTLGKAKDDTGGTRLPLTLREFAGSLAVVEPDGGDHGTVKRAASPGTKTQTEHAEAAIIEALTSGPFAGRAVSTTELADHLGAYSKATLHRARATLIVADRLTATGAGRSSQVRLTA